MFIAKVIGNVWATVKHFSLKGKKMLLIQPIDEITGKENGSAQLAIDSSGAGVGDTVLIIDEGSSCRQILGINSGPTRTIIAGVVDQVSSKGGTKKYH